MANTRNRRFGVAGMRIVEAMDVGYYLYIEGVWVDGISPASFDALK